MNLIRLRETAFEVCQLTTDLPVLVGVSGGPDSLCLLDSLVQLGIPVVVAHFDHQLRPDSGQDADIVRQTAAQLGVPFVLGSQDVAGYARAEHLSLEASARTLRYRFLFAQARQYAAQAVAVGHTADDQVETVLMHFLRGTGLNGLKGMPFRGLLPEWDPMIPLVRPLLGTWRDETHAYCRERGLAPVSDPTNQDTTFFRNRVRHELIPFLETLNPNIRGNLTHMAQLLAGDAIVVQAAVQNAWERCLVEQKGRAVALRLSALQELSEGLQRGVLRQAADQLLPSLQDVDFAAIERARRFALSPALGQIDLVQGLRVFAEGELLWIAGPQPLPPAPEWPQLSATVVCLPVPGEIELGMGWRLSSARVAQEYLPDFSTQQISRWEIWLDAATLPDGVCVRRPHPGDRFQPLGMQGHSLKLSDFWINQKIPRRARAAWPLVSAGQQILWVAGFQPAYPFRITQNTRQALYLRLTRQNP